MLKQDWIPVGDNPYPNLPEITYTSRLDKKQINALAGFRKHFKFPTVTYVHSSKTEDKGMGCAIFRSSEPNRSLLKPGSEDDVKYVGMMAEKWTKFKSDNTHSMKA